MNAVRTPQPKQNAPAAATMMSCSSRSFIATAPAVLQLFASIHRASSLVSSVNKSEEAAPAGRPPGLQIPHSPPSEMVSPQGNPFGKMPCRQGRLNVCHAFCIHCAQAATAPGRPHGSPSAPGAVLHEKAGFQFLDGPRRREAAGGHVTRTGCRRNKAAIVELEITTTS